ncbi:MAG: GNAT family N-acetyltransferase [Actinobacteria bacterium]|nr:GNAT family N-acetyltransferase [Actinomycetota bacterium]
MRPYAPSDRDAVREVCYMTGFMGDPADWWWRDFESFADMWTKYYTDREPESTFVIDIDGVAVGYLTPSTYSERAWDPGAVAARHAIRRLCMFRPGTAGTIWRSISDVAIDKIVGRGGPPKPFNDSRWPSHLHINMLEVARGKGFGRQLVNTWLERLRERGSPGCYLETMFENTSAIAFFESVGFTRHGPPQLLPGIRDRVGLRMHSQAMVCSLD